MRLPLASIPTTLTVREIDGAGVIDDGNGGANTVGSNLQLIHQAGVIQPMPAPPGSERIAIRPTPGTSNGSFITLAPTCAAFLSRLSMSSTAM